MNTSKNIVIGIGVAVAMSLFALVHSFSGSSVSSIVPGLAGERAGLQEFVDGIKAGSVSSKWVSATLPVGTDQAVLYTNRSGKDVFADLGSVSIITGETASSTFKVAVIATTTTSVGAWQAYSAVVEGGRALIQNYRVATSSTATSTSSTLAVAQGLGNGNVLIPDGSSLIFYMQQGYGNVCTGSVCETATSTNRGFNPKVRVFLQTYGNSF